MYANNTTEKFYLYELKIDKTDNSQYWQLTRTFPSKDSLISFLASSVNTHDSDFYYHWTSIYFDELNVTENDEHVFTTLTYVKSDYSNIVLPHTTEHRQLRPYLFLNEFGIHVDVRTFQEEVFARVYASLAGLLPEAQYRYHKRRRQGRAYHHCVHYRTNSHLYTRFLNTHDEEYEDCDGNVVKWKAKPKDKTAKFKWRDDFWTKGPAGWKEHRARYQYEHNLR